MVVGGVELVQGDQSCRLCRPVVGHLTGWAVPQLPAVCSSVPKFACAH
jgi:hypothetical protein